MDLRLKGEIMSGISKSGGYIRRSLLTSQGDIIRRGVVGPEKWALGALGQILISDGNDPIWYSPCNTIGDIPIHTAAGYLERLAAASAGKVLTSHGAGALPTYETPDKPNQYLWTMVDGIDADLKWEYPTNNMDGDGHDVHMSFISPCNYANIVWAAIIIIAQNTDANCNIKTESSYAAINGSEAGNNHLQNQTVDYSLVADHVHKIDVKPIITSLSKYDIVGLSIEPTEYDAHSYCLGFGMEYTV